MLVFGFDCGTVNFGVAAVEVCSRATLKEFIKKWTVKIKSLYSLKSLSLDKTEWLNNIADHLKQLDQEFNQLINMRFVNTFQLIPKLDVENKCHVMENLSIVLNSLVATTGQPDIILIEKQMSINTTAMDIVGGIEMFFRNSKPQTIIDGLEDELEDVQQQNEHVSREAQHNELIPIAFSYWPIQWVKPCNNIQILVMSPVAKNKVALGGNELGNFIAKYSTNYTANKNHADANFAIFIQAFGPKELMKTKRAKQKTNDAADAFMMILAYIQDLWT